MVAIALTSNCLSTGAHYKCKVDIDWEGATITGATAVLVDTVDPCLTMVELTSPIALASLGAGVQGEYWSGIFPPEETIKLLTDPSDANSKLKYETCHAIVRVEGTDADGDVVTRTLHSPAIAVTRDPLYQ